jgi:hypothetical protein
VRVRVSPSPPNNMNLSGSGSVVEHLLAKEKVASSNLVFRSIFVPAIPRNDAPHRAPGMLLGVALLYAAGNDPCPARDGRLIEEQR